MWPLELVHFWSFTLRSWVTRKDAKRSGKVNMFLQCLSHHAAHICWHVQPRKINSHDNHCLPFGPSPCEAGRRWMAQRTINVSFWWTFDDFQSTAFRQFGFHPSWKKVCDRYWLDCAIWIIYKPEKLHSWRILLVHRFPPEVEGRFLFGGEVTEGLSNPLLFPLIVIDRKRPGELGSKPKKELPDDAIFRGPVKKQINKSNNKRLKELVKAVTLSMVVMVNSGLVRSAMVSIGGTWVKLWWIRRSVKENKLVRRCK